MWGSFEREHFEVQGAKWDEHWKSLPGPSRNNLSLLLVHGAPFDLCCDGWYHLCSPTVNECIKNIITSKQTPQGKSLGIDIIM